MMARRLLTQRSVQFLSTLLARQSKRIPSRGLQVLPSKPETTQHTSRHLRPIGRHSKCQRLMSEWVYSKSLRPEFDMQEICDNIEQIAENVRHRKGDADVHEVVELWKRLKCLEKEMSDFQIEEDRLNLLKDQIRETEDAFYQSASRLPNRTHPEAPWGEEDEPQLVLLVGEKPKFTFSIRSHYELGEHLDIIRIKNLGHVTGHRSYYLKGAGAMLEHALIRFTVDRLLGRGFRAVTVPDLVQPIVFEGCGMRTKGLHTQVYQLDRRKHDRNLCLSGTAEVGLAGYFMDRVLDVEDLPQKVFAVSQCFRAETTHSAEAKGLYRVHQFTKVEMFCVTTDDQSECIFDELVAIQKDLFAELGLHFQVLDMPSHDLGAPAFRKYDIEAWMPARHGYGEISSASNCTDYQSRRLRIKYRSKEGDLRHAYTLNGTACAVPRVLLTLLECNQERDGSVTIPNALQLYMNGKTVITKPSSGLLHHTRL
ncbi:serine--tRNA ligase, mitochondrial-like [Patiria miniata]|uniref:serine--tRNA ligase n=1 Tax=Patiria miniata TaxID=46514 RepID=A0A914BA26_PATMI|nr:serine--tRNA ligase, mitochondrial-like [Patiria miniata]XP_038072850.1 serine--tRNA ligase, mitochondrial-like [Patiria miniata]XP_038072851.1 serine--tRNA ligase, mitochondrial-like [Patiria miniata]XP_038072852.1 serine--tRNA ligase, mitochondrial-like [Patiria miniata]